MTIFCFKTTDLKEDTPDSCGPINFAFFKKRDASGTLVPEKCILLSGGAYNYCPRAVTVQCKNYWVKPYP